MKKITSCKTVACNESIIDNNVKRKKIRKNVYVHVDNKIGKKGLKKWRFARYYSTKNCIILSFNDPFNDNKCCLMLIFAWMSR